MAFNIFYNKDALKDLENIKSKILNDCSVILKKIENILPNNPFPFGQTNALYAIIQRLRGEA